MKITFHGGVNEVGGNKIQVIEKDTRIFLDFGVSLTQRRKYYMPPYLTPKSLHEIIEMGLAPKIDGLYMDAEEPKIDAIFISHAHRDHYQYISLINRKIRVYCGETAKLLIQGYSQITRKTIESNLEGINLISFRTGDKIKINEIEVKPIHVDHSVPGAYAYIIYGANSTIAYTGDLRMHGKMNELTWDFINACKEEKIDLLIVEATNMIGYRPESEIDVMNKIIEVARECNGLILARFSNSDIDRFNTFIEAANKLNRELMISTRQAYILEILSKDKKLKVNLKDPSISIVESRKARPPKWEKELTQKYPTITLEEISIKQEKIILTSTFYDFPELLEMKPKPASLYILSSSEPFNEEQEIEYQKFINWLDILGIPLLHIHCSGHLSPHHLTKLIKEINPKAITPIHTEHPKIAQNLLAKYTNIIEARLDKPINLPDP